MWNVLLLLSAGCAHTPETVPALTEGDVLALIQFQDAGQPLEEALARMEQGDRSLAWVSEETGLNLSSFLVLAPLQYLEQYGLEPNPDPLAFLMGMEAQIRREGQLFVPGCVEVGSPDPALSVFLASSRPVCAVRVVIPGVMQGRVLVEWGGKDPAAQVYLIGRELGAVPVEKVLHELLDPESCNCP